MNAIDELLSEYGLKWQISWSTTIKEKYENMGELLDEVKNVNGKIKDEFWEEPDGALTYFFKTLGEIVIENEKVFSEKTGIKEESACVLKDFQELIKILFLQESEIILLNIAGVKLSKKRAIRFQKVVKKEKRERRIEEILDGNPKAFDNISSELKLLNVFNKEKARRESVSAANTELIKLEITINNNERVIEMLEKIEKEIVAYFKTQKIEA